MFLVVFQYSLKIQSLLQKIKNEHLFTLLENVFSNNGSSFFMSYKSCYRKFLGSCLFTSILYFKNVRDFYLRFSCFYFKLDKLILKIIAFLLYPLKLDKFILVQIAKVVVWLLFCQNFYTTILNIF